MDTQTTQETKRVLLAEPRGYCAGVDRAVETVERALDKHGAPVYVRKEIVHNRHVVETLAERGATLIVVTNKRSDLSELLLGGGGIKCCTLELRGKR